MSKKKKKKKKQHRFFWFVIKLQIVLMLVVLAGFGYYYFGGYADAIQQLRREAVQEVSASDDSTFIPSQTCSIYGANGKLITERKGDKNAQYVKYQDIPKGFVDAVISIEDKKFYQHNGVDLKGLMRAVKATALAKMKKSTGGTQGGSTITMQLAKLIYMQPEQTWEYKVKQMFLAWELEKRYSKSKIMEFYLNNVYFANGYYGIQAACHGYFNCDLKDLDTSQIAYLCAIPNRPSYYDPVTNPSHTVERRNLILQSMRDDGKISEEEYYEWTKEEIALNRPKKSAKDKINSSIETYTYDCATRALMQKQGFTFQNYFDTEKEQKAYSEAYDELYSSCQKELFSSGYKIYTSIEMDKQKQLQAAVDDTLQGFTEKSDEGTYKMQGAAVSIDNDSGYVVAIIGGRKQNIDNYTLNRAYQSYRQPGSSIKPVLVYTPQLERGYTPDTIVDDHKLEDGPSNATKTYAGKIPLRYAVAHSINTIAWQLYDELTPKVGLQYLKEMNFAQIKDNDYTLATALGGFTKGVSPIEMASAYATIENDGLYREPTCVKSIVDADENVIYESQLAEKKIYKKDAARMMTDIMTSVMDSGTGRSAKLTDMPCAGKTGTTNDHKDGWFCGFTRYYTTVVWVGCDYPKAIANLSGSTYPAQIWKAYMSAVHADLSPLDFLPYAELSDDFKNQKKEEKEQQEQIREENQIDSEEEPQEEESENTKADDINSTDSEKPDKTDTTKPGKTDTTDSEKPADTTKPDTKPDTSDSNDNSNNSNDNNDNSSDSNDNNTNSGNDNTSGGDTTPGGNDAAGDGGTADTPDTGGDATGDGGAEGGNVQ